jgi:hypothetical protein
MTTESIECVFRAWASCPGSAGGPRFCSRGRGFPGTRAPGAAHAPRSAGSCGSGKGPYRELLEGHRAGQPGAHAPVTRRNPATGENRRALQALVRTRDRARLALRSDAGLLWHRTRQDSRGAIATTNFCVHPCGDVVGTAVARVMKNVVASASGIAAGRKLGENARRCSTPQYLLRNEGS